MSGDVKVYIDWDGDGGLTALGSFESGTDDWIGGGTVAPTVAQSTTRAHHGSGSLLTTWGAGGVLPLIQSAGHVFVVGRSYTLSGWVWVPTGSVDVVWAVAGVAVGATTAGVDQWKEITFSFTATVTNHLLQVWANTAPAGGEQFWLDEPTITITGENVTARVLDRTTLTMQYGRDHVRALSPTAPGQAEFELSNVSRDFSPENGSSPLAGLVLPGRPMVVKSTLASKAYTLLYAYLDDFEVLPELSYRSVRVSAVDFLGKLRDAQISIDLRRGIRTGDAVGLVLDAVGWPEELRDLDPGATTIRWYWEEGTDAFTALTRITNSEGPTAFVAVSGDGRFMFRDRHHRLVRTESTTSQATFRDTGAEPLFSAPLVYDHGWRDIINSVTISVTERDPEPELSEIFSSDRTYSIVSGDTLQVRVEATDPFYSAVTPVAATDYTLLNGTVTVSLSRTAGQSTTINVKASGGAAVIQGLRLRAYSVSATRTFQVHAEDTTSIDSYGRRSYPGEAPWVSAEDAKAIADLILAQRAERLPIVSFRVAGSGNDTRMTQQLARDLSDRITIIDAETGLSDAFYIERIEHRISQAGMVHDTVFGCEKVPALPTNVFKFDVAGRGFNDGKFGASGIDDPDTIFRFDVAGQGFDDGLFAT